MERAAAHTASPVLAMVSHQPKPTGILIQHYPPHEPTDTVVTLEWSDGDHQRCRMCPRDVCQTTERGTCTRVIPGVLDTASAVFFRHPGTSASA